MHARSTCETPSGEADKALDPDLLDGSRRLPATASGPPTTASSPRCRRLTRPSFYEEGAPTAALYGVETRSVRPRADFMAMMDKLSRASKPIPSSTEPSARSPRARRCRRCRALHRAPGKSLGTRCRPPVVRRRAAAGQGLGPDPAVDIIAVQAGRQAGRPGGLFSPPNAPHTDACPRWAADPFPLPQPAVQQRLLEAAGLSGPELAKAASA